ncbi:SDR family oxidoreductase [Streptomonospora litoralis]|uniref:Glucose 1-dehydrogenase 2 n=1 Tax=Streptomonospora litoralis TaxID=2498135 RepID=A0A4P6Q544_9ACTN|nr:SDR family oxidoreductase [Streptomonospora litoralis]QBI55785.1 Glucose 1-dehydrogenase 2 [Streptomonospora litoralis]
MSEHGPDRGAREPHPLRGRTAVVTGVSRRGGIGYAVACRLAAWGASVFLHHFQPHDREQDCGADDLSAVLDGVRSCLAAEDARVADTHADLAEPGAAQRVIDAAAAEFGHVDILVCNHALNGRDGPLGELTEADLDRHWAVDARAPILLTQAFADRHDGRDGGAVVFMTSGQQLGPLPGEVAYGAAKAALAGITTTLADQLADQRIRLNTVNPGPVDTGYLTDEKWREIAPMFPFGRFGEPDDPARLISWLVSDEARWITGQIINTEGGFGRRRPRGS